jgi:hypothetical protein
MANFTITPRGKGYWIEKVADDGTRTPVERYKSEDKALQALKVLQRRASLEIPALGMPSKRIWP